MSGVADFGWEYDTESTQHYYEWDQLRVVTDENAAWVSLHEVRVERYADGSMPYRFKAREAVGSGFVFVDLCRVVDRHKLERLAAVVPLQVKLVAAGVVYVTDWVSYIGIATLERDDDVLIATPYGRDQFGFVFECENLWREGVDDAPTT